MSMRMNVNLNERHQQTDAQIIVANQVCCLTLLFYYIHMCVLYCIYVVINVRTIIAWVLTHIAILFEISYIKYKYNKSPPWWFIKLDICKVNKDLRFLHNKHTYIFIYNYPKHVIGKRNTY